MDLGSFGSIRVLGPPPYNHCLGQAREGNPQATCPTLPCTQLDHWAPLGAPRGGTAGPKSWPKSFGPKLFLNTMVNYSSYKFVTGFGSQVWEEGKENDPIENFAFEYFS